LTFIESHEAEGAGRTRIFLLELVEHAKRLGTIDELGEHAPISVIDKQEAFHCIPLSLRISF
jgi:hypothetical protein